MQIRATTTTNSLATPMFSKQCSSAVWLAMQNSHEQEGYIMSAQYSYKQSVQVEAVQSGAASLVQWLERIGVGLWDRRGR
jgi:cell division protein YceG involved in septum cleavage